MSASKTPLDPSAGSVQAPAGSSSTSGAPQGSSLGHDLNSAHVKKDDIARTDSPGMGTNKDASDDGLPNWQNQSDILDAASHGNSIGGKETTDVDVQQLRRDQHPESQSGKESGPTGLSVGQRNMEEEGTSEHDKLQQDLKDGKPSRDGEGSAGMPFDAGN